MPLKQNKGHFQHFMEADQFQICRGVVGQDGAATLSSFLDDDEVANNRNKVLLLCTYNLDSNFSTFNDRTIQMAYTR